MGSAPLVARRARRLAALAAVALAASCSGSAEGSTTSTTAATTTSTEPTTTTSVAPRPPADRDTIELASAAVLGVDDVGEGWSVHTDGGPRLLSAQSCSYREDGPEAALGAGASQDGPKLQLGDEEAFISSSSYAFPAEQQAVQWIETVRTAEWDECILEQLIAEHAGGDDLELTLDSRQIDHLGEHGFEAFAQFYGRDAQDDITLVINVMHYRMGSVVLENTLVRDAALDPADWSAVDAAHGAAVSAAWARLNELR
jgi:hypothetical protein